MAANLSHLFDVKRRKNIFPRLVELSLLALLFSLLFYRIINFEQHGLPWLIALICESWFTFLWILTVFIKWNQIDYTTYPYRLLQKKKEFPHVDIFVTTADPDLEPPILTMNTVLSLLSVDYPADKLACYLSDDSCSPLVYYSLTLTMEFAKLWVPFCKKYDVEIRAPFRYFLSDESSVINLSPEFREEWKMIKKEYDNLCWKINYAAKNPTKLFKDVDEYADFSNIERRDHPSIVKVIWENKGMEDQNYEVPHIIYISREKNPKHPHNFKAGAMNVLTRVSGVMTNASFMLNLDCDQFVNNPKAVLHAMCLLLGTKQESEFAFVQFPQKFYDADKDDTFGNQLVALMHYVGHGIVGIQGPFYQGTGCFHRRKVIYGASPQNNDTISEKIKNTDLQKTLGGCASFTKLAYDILFGVPSERIVDLRSSLDDALNVARCSYELDTDWGRKVGWIYGSATEDINTGLAIQARGWKTAMCDPICSGFLGCAPTGGPESMTQMKRWSTGLLQVLLSKHSPFIRFIGQKLQFRQALAYTWVMTWGLRSWAELSYSLLSAYCIISNTHFLFKVGESAFFIPLTIFLVYNLYTLSEYLWIGLSIRAWWNNQSMWRIYPQTSFLFGLLSVVPKLFELSETAFEVTKKEQTSNVDDHMKKSINRFTFDDSPLFVPATTVLFIHLTSIAIGAFRFGILGAENGGPGVGEWVSSLLVVMFFWVFFKGLFQKGKHGIPLSTILKSGALTLLFVIWSGNFLG
ncbi:cellulose synthase-like protein H1 [Impatiens glandulifera]|uniref:cellulose synthase-like protein H1 n=1 Tax=Impatiens glandulifera TaxID=253017 RepID=UPI001FB11CE7|nr:cellulose synthase-like protein H1 [Impatiens glandulifera]